MIYRNISIDLFDFKEYFNSFKEIIEIMKVVALISGGKDSCFNMMHCVANGHQIVALANLKPQSKSRKGLNFNP